MGPEIQKYLSRLSETADIPGMTKGYFVSVQTPKSIAFPDVSQNTLLTVAIPLTIEDAVGWAAKVTMTDSEATP